MQYRMSDMDAFFSHENYNFPPSISGNGKLRLGPKSDLLIFLAKDNQNDPPESCDVKFLDGAAVHLLPTTNIVTFDDHAGPIFVHSHHQLENH